MKLVNNGNNLFQENVFPKTGTKHQTILQVSVSETSEISIFQSLCFEKPNEAKFYHEN